MNTLNTNAAFHKYARGRTVAQTSVHGGFPVLVVGVVHESDPEVGFFDRWIDSCDIKVFTLRGCPAPSIEKKLSKSDWMKLETALLEQADEGVAQASGSGTISSLQLEQMRSSLIAVIEHAISLGCEADVFLTCWLDGDWEECASFGFPVDSNGHPYV